MQGLIEPGDGIGAQPVRSLLKGWGYTPSAITGFIAWASLPWALKVLFGVLGDTLPLWGSRRRSYLLLSVGFCAAGMLGLYLLPTRSAFCLAFLFGFTAVTMAIAIADVTTDALMVEVGQPLGFTGQLQSIQWTSMFIASSAAGYLGGWLSVDGRQRLAFLCCALCAAATLIVVVLVRIPESPPPAQSFAPTMRLFFTECRSPSMLGMAGFLMLWNINPFSQSLLYLHMTQGMGIGEVLYGKTVFYMGITSALASASYGFYCHRLTPRGLYHASILLGIFSTLVYLLMRGERTAIGLTFLVGFTYQTASMMQLDLAARASPVAIAGTAFAGLMTLCNLSAVASTYLGGLLYEKALIRHSATWALSAVLILGALLNASCWLLAPLLRRHAPFKPDHS